MTDIATHPDAVRHLVPLLERLTLEQKAALVQGADFWTTVPLPEIGLRAMTLSDGPAGVRGPRWDEREPSLNLPSGSALAASWDVDLAYRYGAAAASEARRKGVDVVLGPTINLHRSPLGGRHFECFSEDPELSAELAAAYVRGLQDNGVAATPKHYVANDSETDRFTVDVQVDERALRELYLAPFERAVEAGAWTIMSAYNAVDGVTMTENDLLETPLNSEWGFDGVVISDWTAVRSLDAVPAAQDLAMPGPAPAWADLVAAIRDGRLNEADLDRKVLRLLLLAERVGALGDAAPIEPAPLDGPAFARAAAIEGTVLLRNEGVLPVDAASLGRVAVIGQNAREARTQGGGSATVIPEAVVSPLDAIRAAVPGADVRYEIGAVVQEGVAEIPLAQLRNPATGEAGMRVAFFDADGTELFAENRRVDRPGLVRRRRPHRGERDASCSRRCTRPPRPATSSSASPARTRAGCSSTSASCSTTHPSSRAPTSAPRSSTRRRSPRRSPSRPAARRPCAWSSPAPPAARCRARSARRSASPPSAPTPRSSSPARRRRPRHPMSRSSSWAPTRRSSRRATTARASTCPATRTTWCARSRRPARRRSSWSTPARRSRCRGRTRSPRSCRATSAGRSSATRSPTCSPAPPSPAGACPRRGRRRSRTCPSPR